MLVMNENRTSYPYFSLIIKTRLVQSMTPTTAGLRSRRLRFMGVVEDIEEDPSSRQKLIPGWSQEKIRNSRVLVVGAGALGNEVIKNLVLLGVGFIRVVDYDVVSPSNLSRSVLFTKADAEARRPKVDAVADGVRRIDPYGYVNVEGVNTDITQHDYTSPIYKGIDVVFTALDNYETRLHVNNQAYYLKIPLIDGGMDGPMGHVQVVIPPYTSCLACSYSIRDEKALSARLKCDGVPADLATPRTPAIITTTSLIAALMVHEFIKIIHGIDQFRSSGRWNERIGEPIAGKRIYVNLSIPAFVIYEVPISKQCPLHD